MRYIFLTCPRRRSHPSNPMQSSSLAGKGLNDGLKPGNTPLSIREVWQPPPFDYIKINVDVGLVKRHCTASVAVVARDSAENRRSHSRLVGLY